MLLSVLFLYCQIVDLYARKHACFPIIKKKKKKKKKEKKKQKNWLKKKNIQKPK